MKSPIEKLVGYFKNKIEDKRLEKSLKSIFKNIDELDYRLDWAMNYNFDDTNYLKIHNPENEKLYNELVQKIEKLKILYPKGEDKFNELLRLASGYYKYYLVNSNQAKFEDIFPDAHNL